MTLPDPAFPEPVITDLSVYQGTLNPEVHKRVANATLLRSQYGTSEDVKFREFRNICELSGITWSPYLFWLSNVDAQQQIDKFKELTGELSGGAWTFRGQFGAYMDAEEGSRAYYHTKTQYTNKYNDFQNRFHGETGMWADLYTRKTWWDANINTSMSLVRGPRVWPAHWGTSNTNIYIPDPPLIPYGFSNWTLHQYSAYGNSRGLYFGVGSRDVDVDRYNGSITDFNRMFGTNLKPLGDTEPEPISGRVMVNVSALNIRSRPVTTSTTLLGSTSYGKIWYVDGMEFDANGQPWYYIGVNRSVYLAAWLCLPL